MSIDVLSDAGCLTAIVVGDETDMGDLQAVGHDSNGRFHLIMDGQQVPLSPEASVNFSTATHLIVVSVSPSAEITTARRAPLNNLADGQELSLDERDALTKALSLGRGRERKFYTEALVEFRRAYPNLAA